MEISDDIKHILWEKARKVDGYDAKSFRKDDCGAWIAWEKYGLSDNQFGWVVDHIYPKALGGDDSIENLRPLQYKNNVSKSDDFPSYTASIVADGNKNIDKIRVLKVNMATREKLAKLYNID
jgi:5-methylcytosine-specific restriction endonuclease McrA